MTETVTSDGSSVAKPVSRPRSRKPATVSASALVLHLDCSRTYVGKFEVEGVKVRTEIANTSSAVVTSGLIIIAETNRLILPQAVVALKNELLARAR